LIVTLPHVRREHHRDGKIALRRGYPKLWIDPAFVPDAKDEALATK
jgi:hypothetical protein